MHPLVIIVDFAENVELVPILMLVLIKFFHNIVDLLAIHIWCPRMVKDVCKRLLNLLVFVSEKILIPVMLIAGIEFFLVAAVEVLLLVIAVYLLLVIELNCFLLQNMLLNDIIFQLLLF